MKPDAGLHNPDPEYLRGLRNKTGMTQKEISSKLGIGRRMIGYYESPDVDGGHKDAPYLYQFALERLANGD